MPVLSSSDECAVDDRADNDLRRVLTRFHVLAIVVGGIVGAGIFIRPAAIAQLLGSPASILGVWLAAGALSLFGALTYAQLAMRIPGTGGEYQFLQATIGILPAFLFGWMRLIIGPAVIATLAVAFTVFVGDVAPIGGPWIHWILPWGNGARFLDLGPRQAIAVSVIAGLAWINSRGVRTAGGFQLAVTLCKVAGLLALLGAILLLGHSHPEDSVVLAAANRPGALTVSAAMLAAWTTYVGWANAAMLGGEIREPARVLPWALVFGVGIVTILYVTTNVAYMQVLSLQDVATANSTAYPTAPSVAGKVVRQVLGTQAAAALPVLFALSALGTAHCNILTMPRVFFSMARDGLLPQSLALVATHSETPTRAIAMLAAFASIFAVVGSYDRLANLTGFSYLLFFALTSFGFLWSRRAIPAFARDQRYWVTTAVAVVFLLGTVWLIVTTALRGSIETLVAVGLIGLGTPIFGMLQVLRSRAKPPA
jgi:basic amino acid/polyamine antiporter, APA family